jgi:hypothetical protein
VSILLTNTYEILRHTALAEQVIQRVLQVSLLPQGIPARSREHLLWSQWREVSGEALEDVAIGAIRGATGAVGGTLLFR